MKTTLFVALWAMVFGLVAKAVSVYGTHDHVTVMFGASPRADSRVINPVR
ncbi:hypothetical protein [Photobacterium alginatilyticum]|nr:hypothetical protein [Photobacterium alginatilyticum]